MTSAQDSVTRLTVSDLARKIAELELSDRHVVEAHIQRIRHVDTRIKAVVVRLFDEADARQARGDRFGPLHGVLVTVKEMFEVAGTAVTNGLVTNPVRSPRIILSWSKA